MSSKLSENQWNAIPESLRGPLARYLIFGLTPGGALRAFLENDLSDFLECADETTLKASGAILKFVRFNFPRGSYGYPHCTHHWAGIDIRVRVQVVRHLCPAFDSVLMASRMDLPPPIPPTEN